MNHSVAVTIGAAGRNTGYARYLLNPSIAEWEQGKGEWWVSVYEWTWRRSDRHYGPFKTKAEADALLEEFTEPRPALCGESPRAPSEATHREKGKER